MTTEILIVFGMVAALYLVLANRLIALVHPARMELADLGAYLLDSDISEEAKKYIKYSMNNAYNGWRAWSFVFLVPVAVAHFVILAARGRAPKRPHTCPEDLRSEYDRFMSLSFWSVISSSPLAAALVLTQLVVYLFLFMPIGVIIRDTTKTAAMLHENHVRLHDRLSAKVHA
jgi:hypothetical protein